MKIKRVTYFALVTLISVASCTKEVTEPDVYDWGEGKIYFKTSLSDVAGSRAQDMTLDKLETFQVTCFNTADREKDTQGYLSPYFENTKFIRKANLTYESAPTEESCNWPSNNGFLRFFAFSPSIEIMANDNSVLESTDKSKYFNISNTTVENQSNVSIGYRLQTMRINPDISRQFDFVTAQAAGERWKDFGGGVELNFSHKLCQIELKAWGENQDGYDFDIAGVRIGNPVVEGTFVFADDNIEGSAGNWEIPEISVKEKVEYLYRSALNAYPEDLPEDGDTIFRINSEEHNTQESAASIMGNGGYAMVIPTKNEKWEGLEDPNIGNIPYATDKMYFSILMRVTDRASGKVIYPYPGNKIGLRLVSYAVDSSGKILKRLYTGDMEGSYFTDSEMEHQYEPEEEGEEIMDFGWAAVPVDADWSAGKKYIYTLNYSDGIGLHDPSDPEPGKIIKASSSMVTVNVEVKDWTEGTTTNVTVPRK